MRVAKNFGFHLASPAKMNAGPSGFDPRFDRESFQGEQADPGFSSLFSVPYDVVELAHSQTDFGSHAAASRVVRL